MKIFLLLITLFSSIYAVNINESLLNMHATLLPKIYLMDYNFKKKSTHNTIIIAILYEQGEYKSAQLLKDKMIRKYKNGIKSYKLNIQLATYNQIAKLHANIYYMFPSSKKKILKAVQKASKEKALTFAYSKEDLQYGIMISLKIAKKTKPLLNLEAIKQNDISLRPILIDISYLYKNQTQMLLNSIKIKKSLYYAV